MEWLEITYLLSMHLIRLYILLRPYIGEAGMESARDCGKALCKTGQTRARDYSEKGKAVRKELGTHRCKHGEDAAPPSHLLCSLSLKQS